MSAGETHTCGGRRETHESRDTRPSAFVELVSARRRRRNVFYNLVLGHKELFDTGRFGDMEVLDDGFVPVLELDRRALRASRVNCEIVDCRGDVR